MPEKPDADVRGVRRENLAILAIAFLAAGLQLWLRFFAYGTFIDDAYIFMRYADNLRHGDGLVYNAGEPVMGFTSPLFTLLLGGVGWLMRSTGMESIAFGLNLGFWALNTWIVASLFSSRSPGRLLAVFLWCFYFPYTDAAINGMETMMFLAGILGTVRLLQLGRWNAAAFLALLSILMRPEGVLLALATLVFLIWQKKLGRVGLGAGFGVILLLIWAGFANSYYGSVLPQSMLAKSAIATSGLSLENMSPLTIFRCLVFGVSSEAIRYAPWVLSVLAAVAGVLATFYGGKERPEAGFLFGLFVLFALFYTAGKPTHIWSWYGVPASVCLFLAIWAGMDGWTKGWNSAARIGSATAIVAVVGATGYIGLRVRTERLQAFAHANRGLMQLVRDRYPRADSVMLADIGIVGYHNPNVRIVDLAGLVSKKTLELGSDGRLLSYGAVIKKEKPGIIAFRSDIFKVNSFEEAQVVRSSFDDDSQLVSLIVSYSRIQSGNPYYVAVFVRKDLVLD